MVVRYGQDGYLFTKGVVDPGHCAGPCAVYGMRCCDIFALGNADDRAVACQEEVYGCPSLGLRLYPVISSRNVNS